MLTNLFFVVQAAKKKPEPKVPKEESPAPKPEDAEKPAEPEDNVDENGLLFYA